MTRAELAWLPPHQDFPSSPVPGSRFPVGEEPPPVPRMKLAGLTLLSALVFALPLTAQSPANPADFKSWHLEPVAPNIYAFIAPDGITPIVSGNSTVIIGDDGVLIVDTGQFPSVAKQEIAAIRKLTPLPVRYIVNTHWHPDHWLGNGAFKAAWPNAVIIATPNTAEKMAGKAQQFLSPKYVEGVQEYLKGYFADTVPHPPAEAAYYHYGEMQFSTFGAELASAVMTPPDLLIGDALTVRLGKREVQVLFLGRANTAGDAVVYVPDARVVATGDLLVNPYPYGYGSFILGVGRDAWPRRGAQCDHDRPRSRCRRARYRVPRQGLALAADAAGADRRGGEAGEDVEGDAGGVRLRAVDPGVLWQLGVVRLCLQGELLRPRGCRARTRRRRKGSSRTRADPGGRRPLLPRRAGRIYRIRMRFQIRAPRASDAKALTELAHRAKAHWGYPTEWLQLWNGDLTISGDYLLAHRSFVAESGGKRVGLCVLEIRGKRATLGHVWVSPECHRKGIGTALVARSLEAAVKAGVRSVEVVADPFAEGFYVRLGARKLRDEPAPMPGAPERTLPVLEFRFSAPDGSESDDDIDDNDGLDAPPPRSS